MVLGCHPPSTVISDLKQFCPLAATGVALISFVKCNSMWWQIFTALAASSQQDVKSVQENHGSA
eukprot:2944088-Rhodomonas_salina.1